MWFKNLQFYRFSQSFTVDPELLEASLAQGAFQHCGKSDLSSQGWVSPLGRDGSQLVHSLMGCHMICLRREDKVLPAAVVNEQLAERVADIEQEQGRTVRRKEKLELKEAIIAELLPRALAASKRTFAYLAPDDGFMVVNAANTKAADELTSYLRKCIDSLPLRTPKVKHSPAHRMTQWLQQVASLPGGFSLGYDCELRDKEEGGGVVRCSGLDLDSSEITTHLEAGKQAVKVAVSWEGHLDFVLAEDLSLKRLRFDDALLEEAGESGAEDAQSRFDASFAIMSQELKTLMPQVLEMFGGEEAG